MKLLPLALIALAPVVVSCSDVDLLNIDSTISVPVQNMVVPINITGLQLGTMLDVDNDGKLREYNGEYAVVVEGDYKSDKVHVPSFTAKADDIKSINGSMGKSKPSANRAPATQRRVDLNDPKAIAAYALPKVKEAVLANTDKVDEAFRKLKEIKTDTKFHFTVNLDKGKELLKTVNQIHIENFSIQLPKGIIGEMYIVNGNGEHIIASYDSKTGLVSFIGKNIYTTNGFLELQGSISGFDANALESAFNDLVGSSQRRAHRAADTQDFNMEQEVGVNTGEIVIYDTDFKNLDQSAADMYDALPASLSYQSDAEMDDIVVTSFSGTFDYQVDDFKLDNVNLNDIPDVLKQSGTSLHLDNPQVYVYLNNPVTDGVGKPIAASTEITIVAQDSEGNTHDYHLNESVEANTSDYFCYLSPRPVEESKKYPGYEGAKHVPFTALADILSCFGEVGEPTIDGAKGDGLPSSISISATNTHVVGVDVENFQLDKDYFINGHYAFVAPLALSADSRIKYTDVIDGWGADIDGIVVTELLVGANVTTDVPFELQFRVTPIDVKGNAIPGTYGTLIVPANAKNAPISVSIKGDIRGLDGIKLDALAVSKEARPLTPGMNIKLDGIKVQVSGKYEDEL